MEFQILPSIPQNHSNPPVDFEGFGMVRVNRHLKKNILTNCGLQ